MDIMMTEKRFLQTEKIEHMSGLPDVIKHVWTGLDNFLDGRGVQTCKTTGTIVGTVD